MQAPGLPSSGVWLGGGCNKKAITQGFRAGHPFRINGWPPPTLLLAMWTLPLPNFIPQCTGRARGAHGAVFVCFLKKGLPCPIRESSSASWRSPKAFPLSGFAPPPQGTLCQDHLDATPPEHRSPQIHSVPPAAIPRASLAGSIKGT